MWSSKTKEEFYTCIADLIEERGLARTHRTNDIDWEHGAVNALERLLKLWIPEVLHRAFLQTGKDIHDFSIDVIIRPTFCKP